jgi:hypothetical protein
MPRNRLRQGLPRTIPARDAYDWLRRQFRVPQPKACGVVAGGVCDTRRTGCTTGFFPPLRPTLLCERSPRLPPRGRRIRGPFRRRMPALRGHCSHLPVGHGRAALPLPPECPAESADFVAQGHVPQGRPGQSKRRHTRRPPGCSPGSRYQPGIRGDVAFRADPPPADPLWRVAQLNRPPSVSPRPRTCCSAVRVDARRGLPTFTRRDVAESIQCSNAKDFP